MVGLWLLAPAIGVRIPASELNIAEFIKFYMLNDNTEVYFKTLYEHKSDELLKYKMKNIFFNDKQKAIIESWYQFPIGFWSTITFGLFVILPSYSPVLIILIAYILGSIVSLLNWKFYNSKIKLLGYIFGGNISSIISILFAIYFFISHSWVLAVIAVLDAFGMTSILAPSVWMYPILSKTSVHPKYKFAYKYFVQKEHE